MKATMKLWSDSWANGDRIRPGTPPGGRPTAASTFSDNVNPHLAWSEVPGAPGRSR